MRREVYGDETHWSVIANQLQACRQDIEDDSVLSGDMRAITCSCCVAIRKMRTCDDIATHDILVGAVRV